jgi:uncharacterized protein (DUF362 family)
VAWAVSFKRGERVVIKPNIGWNRLPEQAANTNPEVVAEVVRLVAAAGASKIWVTDASVNTAEQCFARSGIEKAAKAAGATVVRPDATAFREVDVSGKLLRTADVLFPFVEADRVINVPVVKQHGLSGATMAMKNWYGMLGGQRVKLHQNIHLSIVDLASMIKPTLTIMDATRILLANGPTGGSLSDVKMMDTIAVSSDEVALDAFGASLLGNFAQRPRLHRRRHEGRPRHPRLEKPQDRGIGRLGMFLWLRRSYQAVFLGFFLFLIFAATSLFIRGYDVQWFLEIDPLVALTTALSSHTLHNTLCGRCRSSSSPWFSAASSAAGCAPWACSITSLDTSVASARFSNA